MSQNLQKAINELRAKMLSKARAQEKPATPKKASAKPNATSTP